MTDPITPLVRAVAAAEPRVENRDGAAVGTLQAYLVDKRSGQADFAVLSLGGFLGMGRSFYPVPFGLLDYDAVRDVYVVALDRKQLEGGPSWANTPPAFDAGYVARVASYYGLAKGSTAG
ncbi:PRC-barrel domain-containing protein [uncultured Sphingomonas sp.]|uniref:PRC-barrel domain-containing protein n=1 Tax=uncultured Sphingomonas sp. TaxID=158754 RepID=UPI0035CB1561